MLALYNILFQFAILEIAYVKFYAAVKYEGVLAHFSSLVIQMLLIEHSAAGCASYYP